MLIIDKDGNILQAWFRKNGCVIKDFNYGIEFAIGVPYTQEQTEKFLKIKNAKKYLESTDYKAIKYAEGALTEEEYAPTKKSRAQTRALINELQFDEPTLSRAEIDRAEELAMEKLKEAKNANSKPTDCTDSC